MLYDGYPSVGVRWNGGGGEGGGVGTPQSRGIPTWFILPEPLGQLVLARVHKKGDHEGTAEELSPRARLFELIKHVRAASDEELDECSARWAWGPAIRLRKKNFPWKMPERTWGGPFASGRPRSRFSFRDARRIERQRQGRLGRRSMKHVGQGGVGTESLDEAGEA
jgi:hypothetical protein